MRRRSQTRRVLKWVGTATCMLLGVLWVVSEWCTPYCTLYFGNRKYECSLKAYNGQIQGRYLIHTTSVFPVTCRYSHCGIAAIRGRSHRVSYFWPAFPRHYWPPVGWGRGTCPFGPYGWLGIYTWGPLLLVAMPTAFAWWRDRRLPPGHCQACGYDLTGNVSGRCPECGEPT